MRRWAEAAADSSCRGATRPGRPASPGLSHGDLHEQQHRPGLLQPHRRSHDDRGLPSPGERSGWGRRESRAAAALEPRTPRSGSGAGRGAGAGAGAGCRGGRLRARAGNRPEGLDRVILREPQSSARLRNEGELFSLQSGCAGRGAGDGHSASCAFQGFFTSSAPPGPPPSSAHPQGPQPLAPPRGVGPGSRGWRRPPLCCSCSVMPGCCCGGRARDPGAPAPRNAGCLGASLRSGRLLPFPLLSALTGWVPVSARPKRSPETHSQAPPKRRLPARRPAR